MTADRLRAAARVLRKQAEAATPGPWEDMPMGSEGSTVIVPGTYRTGRRLARVGEHADAAYIATVHPGVGLALADWLDTAASNAERNGWMAGYAEAMRGTSAIRIADLILGGGPDA